MLLLLLLAGVVQAEPLPLVVEVVAASSHGHGPKRYGVRDPTRQRQVQRQLQRQQTAPDPVRPRIPVSVPGHGVGGGRCCF